MHGGSNDAVSEVDLFLFPSFQVGHHHHHKHVENQQSDTQNFSEQQQQQGSGSINPFVVRVPKSFLSLC